MIRPSAEMAAGDPPTDAGRRHRDEFAPRAVRTAAEYEAFTAGIAAIEAEARAAERERIRLAVEDIGWTGLPVYAIAYAAAVRDVLAIVRDEP